MNKPDDMIIWGNVHNTIRKTPKCRGHARLIDINKVRSYFSNT